MIPVRVNGEVLDLMVDTGADVTVLNRPAKGVRMNPISLTVRGVTDHVLPLRGEQTVDIEVQGVELRHRVVIAPVLSGGGGILGRDILGLLGATMSIGSSQYGVGTTIDSNVAGVRVLDENEVTERSRRWIEQVVRAARALEERYTPQISSERAVSTWEPMEYSDGAPAGQSGDVGRNPCSSGKRKRGSRGVNRRSRREEPLKEACNPPQSADPVETGRSKVPRNDGRSVFVRLCEEVVLPQYSEATVRVRVPCDNVDGPVLIEPLKGLTNGIRVARSLSDTEGGVACMQVVNLSGGEVTLPREAPIGRVEANWAPAGEGRSDKGDVNPAEVLKQKLQHLPADERQAMLSLLERFRDVFGEPGEEGCSLPVQHKIDTGNASPVVKRPYRVPYSEKPIIAEHLEDMLSKGVIAPSSSPWQAPVVLVKKKSQDGEVRYRFCTDFRGLNAVTRIDTYPLPLIQETLEQLGNCKYFSTLDLSSGYHQIPIAPEDQEKTAFTTEGGHFEYKKMAFGLGGAPATFQRLMERLLGKLKGAGCFVYLDDVVVYSSTLEEHLQRLEELLAVFRAANLKVNLRKCTFAASEVTYLGHVVSAEGVHPDPRKVSAIKEFPIPRNAREVRSFLGLASYYRRFIPAFAQRAKPLTELTRAGVVFSWGEPQQGAFENLKTALTSDLVLAYPDFTRPFVLSTDASGVALGAVLSQVHGGSERPVCFASRQLKGPEHNYSATERELLAVVWATKLFRCYLLGRRFKLVTDHSALRWLLSLRDPSSKLTRWALRLEEFDYEVEHKPGAKHKNADALSRAVAGISSSYPLTRQDIRGAQLKDPWCRDIIRRQGHGKGEVKEDAEGLWYIVDGAEGNDWRLLVPEPLRRTLIEHHHSKPWAGHPGVDRTLAVLRGSFVWPNLEKDVKEFVSKCHRCAQRKSPNSLKVPLEEPYMATGPFEQVSLDIFGPLPRSKRGHRYLLTFIDNFTRYAEAVPLYEQTAQETAVAFVETIVTRHGVPRRLLTDQGRNFVSSLFKETCRALGTKKLQTTAYHPECNGMVERLHRTITDSIAHFVRRDGRDWDRWVPYALMAYRAIPHSSTGFSPNRLLFGRELVTPFGCWLGPNQMPTPLPGDHIEQLRTRLTEAYKEALQRSEKAYNSRAAFIRARRRDRSFEVGDRVYLHVPAVKPGHCPKFQRPWTGPHRITKVLSKVNYEVELCTGGMAIVHINRLKGAPWVEEDDSLETDRGPSGASSQGRVGDTMNEVEEGQTDESGEWAWAMQPGEAYTLDDGDSPPTTFQETYGGEDALRSDSVDEAEGSDTLVGDQLQEGIEEINGGCEWVTQPRRQSEGSEEESRTWIETPKSHSPQPLKRAREAVHESRLRERARHLDDRRDLEQEAVTDSSSSSSPAGDPRDATWEPRVGNRSGRPRSPYQLRRRANHQSNGT